MEEIIQKCFENLMLITRHVLYLSYIVRSRVIMYVTNTYDTHILTFQSPNKPKAAITPFILMCTVYVHIPIQHHCLYSQSELSTSSFKTFLCHCTAHKKMSPIKETDDRIHNNHIRLLGGHARWQFSLQPLFPIPNLPHSLHRSPVSPFQWCCWIAGMRVSPAANWR